MASFDSILEQFDDGDYSYHDNYHCNDDHYRDRDITITAADEQQQEETTADLNANETTYCERGKARRHFSLGNGK